MIDFYANPNRPQDAKNCDAVRSVLADYPHLKLFKPSPDKAPWHVQSKIDMPSGDPIFLNFWPHRLRAQRNGCASVEGADAISRMIEEAFDDQLREWDAHDALQVFE